jgi:ABC-type multidrug transport system ATPase subunit
MHVCLSNLQVGYSIPLCGIEKYETRATRVKVAGKNGLGKTTLLLGLGGLRSTVRGRIEIDGSPTSETTRANISGVMSDAVAIPNATVSQVTQYIGAIAEASFDLSKHIEKLRLSPFANESCTRVSAGTQQKIRFLAAIARQPPWLLLDEPFEHLDTESHSYVFDQIRSYPGTVWFTDHSGVMDGDDTLSLHRHASA